MLRLQTYLSGQADETVGRGACTQTGRPVDEYVRGMAGQEGVMYLPSRYQAYRSRMWMIGGEWQACSNDHSEAVVKQVWCGNLKLRVFLAVGVILAVCVAAF